MRACVRDATRDQCVSRHVFVPAAPAAAAAAAALPPAAESLYCKHAVKSLFSEKVF